MFASEKVMLEYLGDLLSEESNDQDNITPQSKGSLEPKHDVQGKSQTQSVANESATPYSHQPVKTEPLLKPISSHAREFKEYEDEVVPSAKSKTVEKLLQQIELKQQEEKITKEQTVTVDLEVTETEVVAEAKTSPVRQKVEDEIPKEAFQALFFEVAGLVLAVPLQELGGIHNLAEINSLLGKPDWFKGVMLNREQKINVVDSARWVMPERFDDKIEQSLNYKYLITLGQTNWGLTAERLVETEIIQPDAVKWRTSQGKRPWLFGTIKEKMCALLHVRDLVAMLEQGVNARQQ